MNGTFPMPSLSNSIIVFASFYQIGSGLAIVAVVPPGTRKRGTHKCSTPAQEVWNGKPGPESNNLPWPIAERRVNRRSSQEFSLATGLTANRKTRVAPRCGVARTRRKPSPLGRGSSLVTRISLMDGKMRWIFFSSL
ncbi:MAG: hypothetical protein ACXAEI_06015 [Candidatus Hodarchaeales archaeon]